MRKNVKVPDVITNKLWQCPQGEIMRSFFVVFIAALAFSVSGCFPMANDDNNVGVNGKDGKDGTSSLVSITDEPAGENCVEGGKIISTGIDKNENEILDEDEIVSTEIVCNGDAGDNTLVQVSDEPAGENCSSGGKKIETGIDFDEDGVLSEEEILKTDYTCNGNDGKDGADGADGVDGIDGEDGRDSLILIDTIVGINCDAYNSAGLRFRSGLDENRDGILQITEVDQTGFLCHGAKGADGHNSLTFTDNVVGIACDEKGGTGTRIRSGIDLDDNNTLEAGEVNHTSYVCDGVNGIDGLDGLNGHSSLVSMDDAVGTECDAYDGTGYRIRIGLDLSDDLIFDDTEVLASQFICNGANGIDGVDGSNSLIAIDNLVGVNCDAQNATGIRFRVGLDIDASGILETGEVYATTFVCDGANGADGTDGVDGTNGFDGLNSLTIYDTAVGTACDALGNGGTRVRNGLDSDRSGTLEITEVTSTTFICNGANGADGADGVDGVDGADGADGIDGVNGLVSLIAVDNLVGVGCDAYDGTGQRIRAGLDFNENGVLETPEVMMTEFVCNGAPGVPGINGTDGVDGTNGTDGADGTNGTNGVDGYNSLITVDSLIGIACDTQGNGGQRFQIGLDIDRSGTLELGEVLSTTVLCNGADGANGTDGVDGVDGTNGTDGTDGANGADGYNSLTITDNAVGSSCDSFGNGGARIRSGSDINRNGVLEITEIEYIAYVCNGADGADGTDGVDGTNGSDGADGVDGTNGLSSLMNISLEPNGSNCQYGGQKVEYGLDFNENGVLDIFEVIDAVFTCNGAPGADGSDGADGTDGTNGVDGADGASTALMITDEPVGVNCQHGGKKIESGPDANMDGIPDSVTSTVYSCNERVIYTPQGASSSVCGSFTAIAPSNADHCVFYDAVGGTLNFQGAASTIYVSTGWCASECFDVNGVRIATSVCTGVGFYNINQPTCTHDGK